MCHDFNDMGQGKVLEDHGLGFTGLHLKADGHGFLFTKLR